MPTLHLVEQRALPTRSDAAWPQAEALGKKACLFGDLSAIVHVGRTQAVCTSRRGPACCEALQEHRSRGCRAPKSFCRSAWLPSWQLAVGRRMKTSCMWKIRPFRSSLPIPANTSKTIGRVSGSVGAPPALFLSSRTAGSKSWAKSPASRSEPFEQTPGQRYAGAAEPLFNRRDECEARSFWRLSPLPPSPPAPNPRLNPSRSPSRSNPRQPANTALDQPERACRGDRPAPVPAVRAPATKVRPC